MPRSSRSRPKPRSAKPAKTNVLHQDMKQLLEFQKAQEVRFVPEVADIPRLRFKVHTMYNVELTFLTTANLSSSSAINSALAFSLASAPQYVNYTSCFDQYRILQVNVKIVPTGISAATGSPVYTVIDYDDATVLGSATSFLGYSTLKITPPGVIDERTLAPRIAVASYSGSTFSGYMNASPRSWIDSATPGVQYYGLKYYTATQQSSGNISFFTTMMVQFRSQRTS